MDDGGRQVFIAYPRVERPAATELHDALVAGGVTVFLDHVALRPGDVWPRSIGHALRAASLVVVLVSRRAEGSWYLGEEVQTAIALSRADGGRPRVVPLWLDDEADPPYGLRQVHGLSVPELGVAEVAARLLALVAAPGRAVPEAAPLRPFRGPPRRSPFRPGMPLYAGDFLPGASRRALLATIASDLDEATNVNLVGERRMGRTTMLNHVYGKLLASEDVAVARVSMQDDVTTAEAFYGEMLRGILDSPAGARAVGGHGLGDVAGEITYAALRDALKAVRRVAPAVLLVDEFERCFDLPDGYAFPRFFDSLRSLLGGDAHGAYARAVVATRVPLAEYFRRRQVTSTLPSYLPVRKLDLLTDADVEETLAQPSAQRLAPGQREHAAGLAGRHPCLTQCAGAAWVRALDGGHGSARAQEEHARLAAQVCMGIGPSPHAPGSPWP
jgi:hypothetical protein